MRKINHYVYLSTLVIALFFVSTIANAQLLNLPRASQNATVSQTVGISKVYINYSRPSVNGREVWGKLVPYGLNNLGFGTSTAAPWRAGANENTIIKFTDDAMVEGQPIPAGKYGLHMVIKEDGGATVIFSKNHTSWGSFFYEPAEDALQVDVQTQSIPHVEQLSFSFIDVTANSATAVLDWEKKRIPFKVEFDVTDIVLADIRNKMKDQPGFARQTWEQAANYAANNDGDLEEALGWINSARAGMFFSQEDFNNTNIKATILNKMGKTDDAVATMDSYLSKATIFEAHQMGRTYIAMGMKDKALEVFKMNAEKHKDTWPVDYGLARAYSALGNYAKAIQHLKIAYDRVPDPGNKAAIETNMAKLENGEDIN